MTDRSNTTEQEHLSLYDLALMSNNFILGPAWTGPLDIVKKMPSIACIVRKHRNCAIVRFSAQNSCQTSENFCMLSFRSVYKL